MSFNGAPGLPFRFSDERNVKFVELYRLEPCLWNRRPYLWGARNAAYKRIQHGMNCDAEAGENTLTLPGVKMKIKNMRSSYHQELKKIRTNPTYTPKIPWFAPLHKFLAPFVDKKSDDEVSIVPVMPLRRLQIKLPRLKVPPYGFDGQLSIKKEFQPNQQVVSGHSALQLMPTLTPAPPLRLISPPPTAPALAPAPSQLQLQPTASTTVVPLPMTQVTPNSPTKLEQSRFVQSMSEDEFTFFGLSVGAQLRSMPIANAMVMQSKIQYLLSMERRRINGDTTEVNLFT